MENVIGATVRIRLAALVQVFQDVQLKGVMPSAVRVSGQHFQGDVLLGPK